MQLVRVTSRSNVDPLAEFKSISLSEVISGLTGVTPIGRCVLSPVMTRQHGKRMRENRATLAFSSGRPHLVELLR